ncbi:hypothetical protein MTO96_036660 [Rhipicephalus appendiculatus]
MQACLKVSDNTGKGVIRLANTFTTHYILENTTSPNNAIIGARRLSSTNVVTLTFENGNIPRLVFFLNEATLVQKSTGKPTQFVPCAGSRKPNGVRSAAKLDWTHCKQTTAIQRVCSVVGGMLSVLVTARADIANQPC